ncbi:MAG: threonylcarbamoyl-AMP synthase [Erysipelotrichaceae bacterium]|nr:threonylcarbamoyl-AMP synthase [Erysipelotrichaceae bacterium]
MKTIRYAKTDMDKIINTLISGGILAFPTDTVFGLGCIMDEDAMKKIYEAKERDLNKSLPMMCSGIDMIKEYAYVSEDAEKIIEGFTPGALTIVLKKKENVDDCLTGGKKTIAIRVPDDEWIIELITKMGKPLMVTSANISEHGSLLKWKDVYREMKGKIDGMVCEDARGDLASTIVDASEEEIRLLRQGPIDFERIMEVTR